MEIGAAPDGAVLALSGGIGGAKLALGFSRVLPPEQLTVIANTGDDFEHLGLSISPDLDTLMYTLAGVSDPDKGWGRKDETWTFMQTLATLGAETWFQLGDGDLATHVERTRRLAAGETLSSITEDFCRRLGVAARILPMSDDRVRTRVRCDEGWLDFQDYFVRRRCVPAVKALAYDGAASARPQPAFMAALADRRLRAVVICPSNPYLSVDPILALPDVRDALKACRAPVIAVSPIIGGRAVKGPTAKIMRELGLTPSPLTVLQHYRGLIDGFILDEHDAALAKNIHLPVKVCDTLMRSLSDRERVARCALELAQELRAGA